ncbi:MAG TPA: hypothetical protein VIU14_10910 [Mesorhizobium sp.]|jgi:hypothetical protein
MDGNRAIEKDQGALERIVAMCLALAALAERVSGLSHPVRCLVLWILRPAEAAAREFVAEVTRAPLQGCAELTAIRSGDSARDATRLALRFRAMAHALENLAQETLRFARRRLARLESRQRRLASGPDLTGERGGAQSGLFRQMCALGDSLARLHVSAFPTQRCPDTS